MDEHRVADVGGQQRALDALVPGRLAELSAKSFVYCRYTTVRKTVCGGVKVSPSIAFRSFGTTFQVTGTAATQYSRT